MSIRRVATGLALVLTLLASTGLAVAAGKPAAQADKVNLNTATVEQLSELPGVGEHLAARIIEYRQKSGGFKSTQELMNVKGIGEQSFQKIESLLTTGDASPRASATK